MSADPQQQADDRFAEALARSGARDPRDYYRDRLKDLKQSNADGYASAVAYYQDTLIPSIADGAADPLEAWRAYGLLIAELTAPGRTVAIDETGRSTPYVHPGDPQSMVVHLPDGGRGRALLVGLPPSPSQAQMATYDWLVGGRKSLRS